MRRLICLFFVFPTIVWAEVPRVMTDIAPIHSLTAMVMGDLGTPDLLLPPGADAHDYALRPSEAQDLSEAELVIWVGEPLTPWLAAPLAALASDAQQLALIETTSFLPVMSRDDAHSEVDPHGWLDPVTARAWVIDIAEALSTADPDNAARYLENANAAISTLIDLHLEIDSQLGPLAEIPFIVPHDAYQYFEVQYGLTQVGSITDLHAHKPGPAHIAALQDLTVAGDAVCVFSDLEVGPEWARVITEGTNARTGNLNGTGAGHAPGPALYHSMMREMASAFVGCLGAD